MMTRKADLIALRDTVQAGKWWGDEGIAKAYCAECGLRKYSSNVHRAMSGSVDAALEFFAAVLPGWFWTRQGFVMTVTDDHTGWGSKPHYSARDDKNPARALLIATLNALIDEAVT